MSAPYAIPHLDSKTYKLWFRTFWRRMYVCIYMTESLPGTCGTTTTFLISYAVLSCSAMPDSLWPHGLQPARLLCPWGFSRQEYWSGLPCSPSGDLLTPGTEPWSPALQAGSLPDELPGKPLISYTLIQNKKHFFLVKFAYNSPFSHISLDPYLL